MTKIVPKLLFIIYLITFTICAINPYSRSVWWAENIPIILIVLLLIFLYQSFQFSNISYILMSFLIILHTIGGHFTFERVPFDFINDLIGSSRNQYDRIAHFTVGFYAYPVAELILEKKLVRSKTVLFLFPIMAIFSVAAVYEIIEWLYAVSADPASGNSMLGSQGDIWDAQKDMLADSLGALFAMILFGVINWKRVLKID